MSEPSGSSGFFPKEAWHDQTHETKVRCDAAASSKKPAAAPQKRLLPHEEWFDYPVQAHPTGKQPRRGDAAAPPSQPKGRWFHVAQELSKAVLGGDHEVALQVARMNWAGDRELSGLR